jgi:hypothetical protein
MKRIIKNLKAFFGGKAKQAKDSVRISFNNRIRPKKTKGTVTREVAAPAQKPAELKIEESKFSSRPRSIPEQKPMRQELPYGYEEDKIVLQVRDPWWMHSYWEVTANTRNKLKESLGNQFFEASWAIRVYDVSFINFNGDNAHSFFDIMINPETNNWYINVSGGRSFCVDLGLKLKDGRFITIVRSNTVTTPTDGPSWITDEEWMIPDDLFQRLYGLSFGLGSSPRKGIKEIIKERFISSPGLASMASPVKIRKQERNFWLVVNTELIVYGATEPDAKVTVQNKKIRLNRDGTFSLRFALPDGKQVIPVRAESQDGIDVRVITPIVTKESK